MEIQFYKLVAGNSDLILVNMMDEVVPADNLLSMLTRALCARHTGVGAQGTVFLLPGTKHQLSLRYFFANGRESLLTAEPLIYASRYLFDAGIMGKSGYLIETAGGESRIRLIDSSNFAVTLGIPNDADGKALSGRASDTHEGQRLVYESGYQGKVPLTLIEMGIRGAVFFREETLSRKRDYALKLTASLKIKDPDLWVPVGVYPFKSDEMEARGWGKHGGAHPVTSAAIGAIASMIQGFSDRSSLVHVRGSQFFVQWNEDTSIVDVSGSANYVFTGSYFFDQDSYDFSED